MQRAKLAILAFFIALGSFGYLASGRLSGKAQALGGTLSAPTNVIASDGDYSTKVGLHWDTIRNATTYRIYRNITNDSGSAVDVGTTVDELVTALIEQKGREASAPTDVTVGGFPAKRIDLTVPADLDTSTCTNGVLRYWPAPGPDLGDGDCCAPPGSTDSVYVVDVAGNRLVVVARYYPGTPAENRAELQGVVDSIEIEP